MGRRMIQFEEKNLCVKKKSSIGISLFDIIKIEPFLLPRLVLNKAKKI
jgi:hypothetical protein